MTVADIKEYIDNAIDTAFAQSIAIDTAQILKKALLDTKGFLDELEPKAKWKVYKKRKGEIKIGADIQCSNCGSISDMLTNYCYWCGCKMDDEPMEIIESEGEHNMTIEDYLEENNK